MENEHIETKYFVSQLDEDFFCSICHSVLIRPHSCQEGHSFCHDCILLWLETSNTCPCDRTHLSKKKLTYVRSLNNILMKLKVWCRNHVFEIRDVNETGRSSSSGGCYWTGNLGDLQTHIDNNCKYTQVECRFEGCKIKVQRWNLDEHMKECKWRPMECNYCRTTVPFNSFTIHVETCDRATATCDLDCGLVIEKRHRESHREVCPLAYVNCRYSSMGCKARMFRRDLPDHISESAYSHMDLMLHKISQLEIDKVNLIADFKSQFDEMKLQRERDNSALLSLETKVAALAQPAEAELSWTIPNVNDVFYWLTTEKSHFSQATSSSCCGGYTFRLCISREEHLFVGIYIYDATDYTDRVFQPIHLKGSILSVERPIGEVLPVTTRLLKMLPSDAVILEARHGWGFKSFITIEDMKKHYIFPDGSIKLTVTIRVTTPAPSFIV